MATQVRPAGAGDTAFVAWVILAASRSHLPRGAWDIAFDLPDAECLAILEQLAGASPPSFCSWRGFLVAAVDGTPAAALSGYDPAHAAPTDPGIDAVLAERGWTAGDIEMSNARLAPFTTCVPSQPDGMWIVEWVATRPEFRRRGLVDRLLDEILEVGRRRGYADAQVAALIGNVPAQRAYEKHGFRVHRERVHPAFAAAMGCPGIVEMRRRL